MKKLHINLLFIILIMGALILLNHFNIISRYPQFMLIPAIVIYYFGQFVQKHFK